MTLSIIFILSSSGNSAICCFNSAFICLNTVGGILLGNFRFTFDFLSCLGSILFSIFSFAFSRVLLIFSLTKLLIIFAVVLASNFLPSPLPTDFWNVILPDLLPNVLHSAFVLLRISIR